eukprot:SM000021S06417  [mRNA]  locus=s21:169259:170803:- [translate_table: standard]
MTFASPPPALPPPSRPLPASHPGRLAGLIAAEVLALRGAERAFPPGARFLYYERSRDFCTGVKHWTWSFLCAAGEALYLNRTFVLDTDFCLQRAHTGTAENVIKDFRMYYDAAHFAAAVPSVPRREFLARWKAWDLVHPDSQVLVRSVDEHVSAQSLLAESATVVRRRVTEYTGEDYWYKVCDLPANAVIVRPYGALWKTPWLMHIVDHICDAMAADFACVHVRRGDKVKDQALWPNLDYDTRPPKLLATLLQLLPAGMDVYVASDETEPGFFEPLRRPFRLHVLDDFVHLWGWGSEWYERMRPIAWEAGLDVEFDDYMRAMVDYEVLVRARERGNRVIETFNNLTSDPRHGVKLEKQE